MTQPRVRPWYAPRRLVADYRAVATTGGDLKMLKTLKILRSIIVNLGIIGVAIYGLSVSGDATVIAAVSIITLGLYNGIEVADYAALVQAFDEVKHDNGDP